MSRFLIIGTLALAGIVLTGTEVRSEPGQSSNHTKIRWVRPLENNVLAIEGEHFACKDALVKLDGTEPPILACSPNEILVLLAGNEVGTYRLQVIGGPGEDRQDSIDITLGTVGPEGPAGPSGLQGLVGPEGLQGPPGPQGPAGPQGATGPQGLAGADGAAGAIGPVGPAGPQGAQGPAGKDGATGATGPAGPQGPVGAQGAQGPQGLAGTDGATGATGATGPAGPVGPQGLAGSAGPAGPQGAQGPQGLQGPAGADGAAGPMGPAGFPGPPGATGDTGPAGAAGPPGPAGPAGATGAEGPAGPQGPPGATFVAQHTWSAATTMPCCNFAAVSGSAFPFTSKGGGPLLIQMNVSMINGGHSSCAPMIDGVWAGLYGGLPNPGSPTLSWRDGVMQTAGGGWRQWSPTRVYPGVPAGDHTFELRCVTDWDWLTINNGSTILSYLSIIELR